MLPDEPAPVRLMNTIWADRAGVHDDIRTTSALVDWLAAISATDGPVRVIRDDLSRARRLRDALRRVAALCTDDNRVAAVSAVEDIDVAIAEINSLVAGCPTPRLALRDGQLVGDTANVGPPVTRALTAVAGEAVELFTGADSQRGSGRPMPPAACCTSCRIIRAREWCSSTCGNRARAARHYRRHRRGARADSA